jgi:hypothetical protein
VARFAPVCKRAAVFGHAKTGFLLNPNPIRNPQHSSAHRLLGNTIEQTTYFIWGRYFFYGGTCRGKVAVGQVGKVLGVLVGLNDPWGINVVLALLFNY